MPVGARGRPAAGYGITDDSDEPPPFDSMSDADKLWLALREEPIFGATNAEIAAFIEDSAREYGDYVTFVNKLRDDLGSRCVIYRGLTNAESEGLSDLLNEFSDTGLHVYGPTFDQLLACAGRLVGRSEDLIEDAFADSPGTLVEAYKNALQVLTEQDASDSADGAAVNCQSLVLRMGNDGRKVLLTGDMQFAQPDVGEASQAVKDLLATVNEDAPFDWVKLSHHGATNGQNKTILTKWGKRFTISTGSTSSKHPTEPTLKALEQIESTGVEWSRVDMNGRCTFAVEGTSARLKTQRGDLNDKTRPSARSGDEVPVPVEGPVLPRVQEPVRPQIVRGGASDETIEIIVRLPNRRTKFSFTCEVDPGEGDDRPFDGGAVVEAKSTRGIADRLRGLPRLLFVMIVLHLGDDLVRGGLRHRAGGLGRLPRAGGLGRLFRLLRLLRGSGLGRQLRECVLRRQHDHDRSVDLDRRRLRRCCWRADPVRCARGAPVLSVQMFLVPLLRLPRERVAAVEVVGAASPARLVASEGVLARVHGRIDPVVGRAACRVPLDQGPVVASTTIPRSPPVTVLARTTTSLPAVGTTLARMMPSSLARDRVVRDGDVAERTEEQEPGRGRVRRSGVDVRGDRVAGDGRGRRRG